MLTPTTHQVPRILQVSAEIFPLLKTGGLADIAGALPQALRQAGCDLRLLLPGFPAILAGLHDAVEVGRMNMPWGDRVVIRRGELALAGPDHPTTTAYVLISSRLFDRPGNPYLDADGRPYDDNHRRFGALGWVAAALAQGRDARWLPQIIHSHDWHAGLAPACLAHWRGERTHTVRSVFTVHNLAYQGLFPAARLGELGLPAEAFHINGVEFHGLLSFMKAGLYYADFLTTVSPTYAVEIQTPEQGCGLDGLLRGRADHLAGILNAVDAAVWNPATDTLIPYPFDASTLAGKASCKAALQDRMGLAPDAEAPLFAVVSRLSEQKGLPLVLAGADAVLEGGGQLLVLGSGEAALEQSFAALAQAHPGRVAVHFGYDEHLAHQVFAGSDVTLVPSRFEPCGLTQMYGLKYGSVPLVRRVGGLADTVVDADLATLDDGTATGIVFNEFSADAFRHAVRRTLVLYRREDDWRRVQRAGMAQSFDWAEAAARYRAIYLGLLAD